ncbi:GspH/FimT family pseudopilin [Halomonas alkalisoli]|uniref:GspH/FimT family pseudopilin n=1 Tax=Halomonas alkalisoli TaxID=2907158 RepID=UPI001F42E9F1|nr:GspH/FimT family pseudopilin [Halomonas alkalisoli]MCE9683040.1 GspH/FimT family pseudopilin [Halomonas alkalisoli]
MKSSGFTLIELLVTIAVMSIIATIAVPGFQGMMASNRLASDYNEILSGLNLARSEAIKRRQDVSFEVITSSPWEYRVYVTDDGSGNAIRVRQANRGAVSVSDGNVVEFNRLGRIVESSDCDGGCTLTVGSKSIQISSFGRIGRGGS